MRLLAKSERLAKKLGLLHVYAIATGTTLSAGFFLLPGIAVVGVGPALPLAYLIAVIPLVPAMFSILELATAMPRAGGVYYFLDRSLGPMMGIIGGMGSWLALSLKSAFALVGMSAYIHLVFPAMPVLPAAIGFALLFGLVNCFGVKSASTLQLTLVGGLLLILFWLMGGIFEIDPKRFHGFWGKGADSLLATAGLVYISYVGLTNVASVSEEVTDPGRNLPLGVVLSLVTALVVYVVGTTVMVGIVPMEDLANDLTPVATAATLLAGKMGKILMVIAALLAFSSVANAGILSASRYPLAMSRDHAVPPAFARLTSRGIPIYGVLATVSAIVVILLIFDVEKIAKLASTFQLLLFALTCFAVIIMRESHIASYDPAFRAPFYPWMQIIGLIVPFGFIAVMGRVSILFSLGLLAVGAGWYFYHVAGRANRGGAIYHVFERLGRKRFEGLDAELRGILKEKGLRYEDPFDEIVARSNVFDAEEGSDFEGVARKVSALLADRVSAEASEVLAGFLQGTRVGITPVIHGVALPHIRLAGLRNAEMVLVRSQSGIYVETNGEQKCPRGLEERVRALLFFVSPGDNPGQHLRILAQIAERMDDDGFLGEWLQAANEQELKETLLRNDRYLSLVLLADSAAGVFIGRAVAHLGFPAGCLIALVRRGDFMFVPRATTILEEGDRLTVIGEPDGIFKLEARIGTGLR